MNCKQIQYEMLDALAAGQTTLSVELMAHQRSCADCQNFYETQSCLFRSIDQTVSEIANSPVPPSLLPMVRSRVQVAHKRRSRFGWLSAGVVGAVVCAMLVAQFRHVHRPDNSELPAIAAVGSATTNSSAPSPATVARLAPPTSFPHPARKRRNTEIASRPHLEVIVDRKEADDLARLASSVRQKPAWGQGFLSQAPVAAEQMKPLPDIEIAELKVTPLVDDKW